MHMIIAVFARRLRPGVTVEQFVGAWAPEGCELFERMRTPVLFCVVSFRGVPGRPALSLPFCVFGGRAVSRGG